MGPRIGERRLQRRQVFGLGGLAALGWIGGCAAPRHSMERGREELLEAVRAGDVTRARRLLAETPALCRSRDESGISAFALACLAGHDELAGVLRDAGYAPDLEESVLAQDWERMETLAVGQAELWSEAHALGGTPLYAGALVGSTELWRLRAAGCASDAVPEGGSGFTPARGALTATHEHWARIALTDLLANGGDVNHEQRGGDSVLHGAVRRRSDTLVRLAIRKGARVEARDDAGRTAEELAHELGWAEGAQLLHDHAWLPRDNRGSRFAFDANRQRVRRPDLSGVPEALQSQVTGRSHFDLDGVKELVSRDRRLIWSISYDAELAIEACAHTGHRELIRFYLDRGAPLSLPTAVALGDESMIDFHLERDPTLAQERGAHDFPVMWYAALGGGGPAIAERLLAHGVSLEQESLGATVLHWCAFRDDVELAAYAIERGAHLEPVGYKWNRDGQTPLQVATWKKRPQLARLLRQAGARA